MADETYARQISAMKQRIEARDPDFKNRSPDDQEMILGLAVQRDKENIKREFGYTPR